MHGSSKIATRPFLGKEARPSLRFSELGSIPSAEQEIIVIIRKKQSMRAMRNR